MKTVAHSHVRNVLLLVFTLSIQPLSASAAESYSPYAGQSHPTHVFWGDTHVHTFLSGDAFALGTRLTPGDAYRFAKGETIRATGGEEVRLRRPLDFLMVADHAENLGVLPRLAAGDGSVPATEVSQRFAQIIAGLSPLPDILNAETYEAFNRGNRSRAGPKTASTAISRSPARCLWRPI